MGNMRLFVVMGCNNHVYLGCQQLHTFIKINNKPSHGTKHSFMKRVHDLLGVLKKKAKQIYSTKTRYLVRPDK